MSDRGTIGILGLAGLLLAHVACNPEYELTGDRPDVNPGEVTDCGFTPVAGTKISQYDCNPVFAGTDEGWGAEVGSVGFYATDVLGHPFYQMWYTANPSGNDSFGQYGVGYAVSADGTDWEMHPTNPLMQSQQGSWDQDSMAGQVVVWDDDFDQYVMAYQGYTLGDGMWDPGIWGLGIATSPDGVTWSKHPQNPVIDFTEMQFSGQVSPCWPLTMTKTSGGFKGYLAANTPYDPWSGTGNDACEIYAATALDLGVWTMGQQPILAADQWYDAKGVAGAAIAEYDGVLYMFYIGFEEWVQGNGYQSASKLHLALATSHDGGMSWIKDPNNPIPINLTEPALISAVGAQVIGSRIHLWVTDQYAGIDKQAVGYFYFEPDAGPHP